MKIIRQWALALLAMTSLAHGGTSEMFKQANADFEIGDYGKAVEGYEEILKNDGPRVSVLKNLGSAYFKNGKTGRAILAFERALVLKPRDPDLLANLKLAQDQAAVFPVKRDSIRNSFLAGFSQRNWSKIALVTAGLVPLLAFAWILTGRNLRIGLGLLAAADLSVLGLAILALSTASSKQHRGIVLGSPAKVRVSPFEKADGRGSLAEGREVNLEREENGYFWVTADEGSLEGWVAKSEVSPVIP